LEGTVVRQVRDEQLEQAARPLQLAVVLQQDAQPTPLGGERDLVPLEDLRVRQPEDQERLEAPGVSANSRLQVPRAELQGESPRSGYVFLLDPYRAPMTRS